MSIINKFLSFGMVLMISGCCLSFSPLSSFPRMHGTVVDAESGQPIEGAVVLVEWTVTKGMPGMNVTETYKVIEEATDWEGKVTILGELNPFINPPEVTVYKKGYVAWNSQFIFPNYEKRSDFKWQNGYAFKMEKFRPEYTYSEHWSFISGAVESAPLEKKKLMLNAIRWEEHKAFEERRKGRPK